MSSIGDGGITIGDLAERTGLTVATLRAWESRYQFPLPQRRASGHRRYSRADAEQVAHVQRLRAAGLSLETAIAQARAVDGPSPTVRSVFAELRRAHPELPVHVLSRRAMVAISTAIEDASCATASPPLLIGFFQRERFYRARQARWRELATTAAAALVFADFPAPAAPPGSPVEIPLADSTPLRREWLVICRGPDAAACLVGWERPPTSRTTPGRRFEAVWSLDPDVTATAARIALSYATATAPEVVPSLPDTTSVSAQAGAGLARATEMTNRIIAYLDAGG